MTIKISTAGAQEELRGHGGYAAIIELDGEDPIVVLGNQMGGQKQQMELSGAAAGLMHTLNQPNTRGARVEIQTASPWLVQTFQTPQERSAGRLRDFWHDFMELGGKFDLTFALAEDVQDDPMMTLCEQLAQQQTRWIGNANDGEHSFRLTPEIMDDLAEKIDEGARIRNESWRRHAAGE